MCERNVPKIIALGFEDILERVFSAIAGKEHESRRKGEIKDHDGGGKCSKRTNQGGMVISEPVQTIPSLEARCVSDHNRDFNYRKIMYEKGEKGRGGGRGLGGGEGDQGRVDRLNFVRCSVTAARTPLVGTHYRRFPTPLLQALVLDH